jgi:hypothetical protein
MSHDTIRANILHLLPADGSSIGNGKMQNLLADAGHRISEQTYFTVRDALVAEGILTTGRGRGGSIKRVQGIVQQAQKDMAIVETNDEQYQASVAAQPVQENLQPSTDAIRRVAESGSSRRGRNLLNLSDAEKQDIIRYLEADRPLPDKYRFLLFEDKREVELVWNGKTNEVCNVVLPFQTIEQVDEPRAEQGDSASSGIPFQESLFDTRGRQLQGWTNKLIWGDNKLILSSLKNGPLREVIEQQGGLKLIYIDPPFDVGADFSMDIEIGGDTFTKRPSIIEEIAYRDTWGKGADSFVSIKRAIEAG